MEYQEFQDQSSRTETAYLDSFQLPMTERKNSLLDIAIKRSNAEAKWRSERWKRQ